MVRLGSQSAFGLYLNLWNWSLQQFLGFGWFLDRTLCCALSLPHRVVAVAGLTEELPVDGSDGQAQSEAAETGPHLWRWEDETILDGQYILHWLSTTQIY